jgi:hypothetical protein
VPFPHQIALDTTTTINFNEATTGIRFTARISFLKLSTNPNNLSPEHAATGANFKRTLSLSLSL